MIVNYSNKQDAIQFIQANRSKYKINELNDALKWADKIPQNYESKEMKIDALIEYLETNIVNNNNSILTVSY